MMAFGLVRDIVYCLANKAWKELGFCEVLDRQVGKDRADRVVDMWDIDTTLGLSNIQLIT